MRELQFLRVELQHRHHGGRVSPTMSIKSARTWFWTVVAFASSALACNRATNVSERLGMADISRVLTRFSAFCSCSANSFCVMRLSWTLVAAMQMSMNSVMREVCHRAMRCEGMGGVRAGMQDNKGMRIGYLDSCPNLVCNVSF